MKRRIRFAASSPTFAFSWRNVITATVVTWGVGTLLLFARLFFGLIRLAGFRARCLAMTDQQTIELLSEVASTLGMATTPRLLSREGIDVPMALGFLRPAIVMPARLENIDGLREILIHEAAHLVRRDPLVGLLQRVAGALFWPHPLIFYLNRSLSRACEEVCDNYVLQFGDRFRYSRVLVALGGTFEQGPSSLAAVALMSSRWDLTDRITGLLDDRRNVMLRARPLSKFATAMLLPAIGLTLGLLRSCAGRRARGYRCRGGSIGSGGDRQGTGGCHDHARAGGVQGEHNDHEITHAARRGVGKDNDRTRLDRAVDPAEEGRILCCS